MAGSGNGAGMAPPDPRSSFFVFAHGRKGSGKSHYARAWFDAYPGDRLVIDPTGDVARDLTAEGVNYQRLDPHVLPARFPEAVDHKTGRPVRCTCALVPDMGSATVMDDIDRAIGLLLRGPGRPAMLWVDEVGAVTSGAKTPPNFKRVLHQGRHHDLTVLMCGPRAMDVDPLCIAQADLVASFKTPQVYDRQRVADTIGYDRGEFDQLNNALHGHEYTAYDVADDQMYVMPPLPPRRAGRNAYAPVPG